MKVLLIVHVSLLLLLSKISLGISKDVRYILYDVNPGEGFNLRRDVFGRMGVFVKKLNIDSEVSHVLVLPPWDHLYHWQSRELSSQRQIPWGHFFDLEGISRYVPVLEFHEFLESNSPLINATYYLQPYKEGWGEDGHFEEKMDPRECIERNHYQKLGGDGTAYTGYFWGYDHVRTQAFSCISVQGSTYVIRELVMKNGSSSYSVMIDRAENLLHDWFGDEEYWTIRRSTRFNSKLMGIANEFRRNFLDSNDEKDDTVMEPRWEDFRPPRKSHRGGPYLSAHIRRKDFLNSRSERTPSLEAAANQLRSKLKAFNLSRLFIATDAPGSEFDTLKGLLPDFEVFKFQPSAGLKEDIKDGGVAIVDQIIASHARYFIGSSESTFTFRIQEEREILGFQVTDTFDVLCPDGKSTCSKGSVWKIVYPARNKAAFMITNQPHSEL